ncbi:MAG: DUF4123 domain-containing protein [Polyangiaceae bacterium]
MFVELRVLHEAGEPPRAVAGPGQTIQVGRLRHRNQLAMPDPLLAPVHFSLTQEGAGAKVKDLNVGLQKHAACASECFTLGLRNAACHQACRLSDRSANIGLWVNGAKVQEAVLQHGDIVMAGKTSFSVAFSETPPVASPAAPRPGKLSGAAQQRLLEFLASEKLPLFALLDAARAPELLGLLRMHSEVYYSLYDGAAGEKLDDVAPYLVQLHARSPLTQALVQEQWGNSWGVFLWALTDFKALRRQLRRFLMVQDAHGKEMYFRFYDPRVLRVFLPTCTAQEATDFFGPVGSFVIEADEPNVALACSMRQQGATMRVDRILLGE